MLRRLRALWIYGILLFSLCLTVSPLLFVSLSENEGSYVFVAKQSFSEILHYNAKDQSPGYFFLIHYWIKLVGTHEFALRLPSVLLMLASIFLVYRIGLLIGSLELGLLSAALTAFSPLVIGVSQEVRHWTLFLFLSLLSVFFLARYLRKEDRKSLFGFCLASVANLYTCFYAFIHFSGLFAFLFCCGLVEWFQKEGAAAPVFRTRVRELLLVFGISSVLAVPQLFQMRGALGFANLQGAQWGIEKRFPTFFLIVAKELMGFPETGGYGWAGLTLGLIFFTAGILRSDWKTGLFALLWMVPLLVAGYEGAGKASIRARYFVTLVPMVSFLVASGILSFQKNWLRVLAVSLILGMTLPSLKPYALAHFLGRESSRKEDWRGALGHIEKRFQKNDVVILVPRWAIEVVRVYTALPVVGMNQLQLNHFLHYRRAWVISFDTPQRADPAYPRVESAAFKRIEVKLYDLHPLHDFSPETPRGVYDFREHWHEAKVSLDFIRGGHLNYSVWNPGGIFLDYAGERGAWGKGLFTQRWEPGKNLILPEEKWKMAALTHQKSGGELRPVIWAHPVERGVLSITYPQVPLDRWLHGFIGFTDYSVERGHAPVVYTVTIGDQAVFKTLKANQKGWLDFEIPTTKWQGRSQPVTVTIFSGNVRWRHFCFDLWVDKRAQEKPSFSFERVKVLKDPKIHWPKSVRISPDGRFAYVQNLDALNTMVFDTQNFELLRTIPHEGKPVEGAFTQGGRYFWISYLALIGPKYPPYKLEWTPKGGWDTEYRFPSVVVVYDSEKNKIVHRIPVAVRPKIVASSPDERYIFVSNWSSDSVSVIDTKKFKVTKEIPVGLSPRGITFSKDGRLAYVAIMRGQALGVIDVKTLKVLRRITEGIAREPRHLVRNRAGDRLYLSSNGSGLIQVMDLSQEKVVQNIKVANGPRTIVLSPDEKWLYAVNYGSKKVSVVDLQQGKEVMSLETAENPVGMDITPDGQYLWVTCYRGHQVMVFKRTES